MHHGALSLALCLALAACGAHARPPGPSAATRAAIERAETDEKARRHDLARQEYEQAIATAPDRASELYARMELASALEFWGELDHAVTQLETVVGEDPSVARAWHDLGILRHQLGDDAGARTALERAVALAAHDPRPRIALAALLWQTGDLAGAEAQYRALLGLDLPDNVRAKVEWAISTLARATAATP